MNTTVEDKIVCEICGQKVHVMQRHLEDAHSDISIDKYQEMYPDSPILSAKAEALLAERAAEKKETTSVKMAETAEVLSMEDPRLTPLNKILGVKASPTLKNASGEHIMAPVNIDSDNEGFEHYLQRIDENYVFDADLVKLLVMSHELNIPMYLWGHAGTGKTSLPIQLFSRMNKPIVRVPHTADTTEEHIVGMMGANAEGTYFEPGPLPIAMRYGLIYIADEYDFAFPQVLSTYQSVLEGNSLLIKDAPPEWRIVKPHKNFRFIATGNTNGAGDESGLYQGTNIQNAANYERFGIVKRVEYMDKRQETRLVQSQTDLVREDAVRLVEFASLIRRAYDDGTISNTLGPRVLINIGRLWIARSRPLEAIELAFSNRLSEGDRVAANEVAQRVFG